LSIVHELSSPKPVAALPYPHPLVRLQPETVAGGGLERGMELVEVADDVGA